MDFQKVKLDHDLELVLSNEEGAEFGIENWKIIAIFAGRGAGKVRRYAKDGRLDIIEKFGIMKLISKTFKQGKVLDFEQLDMERRDMNAAELQELNNVAINSYVNALKEDESVDGSAIISEFMEIGLSVFNFVKNRVENKMAA